MREEKDRWEFPLLDSVDALHGHVVRSSDGMPAERALYVYNFIKWRAKNWKKSLGPKCEAYDNAVRDLCKASITEYELYSKAEDLVDAKNSTATQEDFEEWYK